MANNKIKEFQKPDTVGSTQQVIPEFYVNSVSISPSVYEFELTHMLLDSEGRLKGAFNVRMSPQTAKAVLELLTEEVAAYEKQYGKLPS
jgi:hypothetical protein